MLRFQFDNIEELKELHYEAVEDYVKSLSEDVQNQLYANIIQLFGFENFTTNRDSTKYSWLKQFILADLPTLRNWVETQPQKLLFKDFYTLYVTKFSNGAKHFVDSAATYNAYALIKKMNIQVCPYCDDEYIDVVSSNGREKRTSEFDHFFPKGQTNYPALAMCFYNLVLSGGDCNGVKLEQSLGVSPYDEEVEKMTFLYPDLEVGVNMDSIEPEQCKVLLHAKKGMVVNEKVLGLKERYANRYQEAYVLLRRKQHNNDSKIEELVRMGVYLSRQEALDDLFGPSYQKGKFQIIHQKMKKDLVGY